MRVLQIGLSKVRGGIESFAMTYFRSLKEKGIYFDFVDVYGEGLAYSEEITALGGRIYTLKDYKKHPIEAKRRLKQIIRENGYSCVHIHMLSAANLLPLIACKEAGVTPIVHSHNTATIGLVRKMLHAYNARKLRSAEAVRLACGTEAGDWMYGSREFQVIPNAVDVSVFAFDESNRREYRQKWNIPDDKIVLGFVGRLEQQKNPLFLLEVLSALQAGYGERYLLLIVGGGSMESQMREEVKQRGLEDAVVFAGNQSHVGRCLSAMDLFLLPSLFEGLVISGVEAQCNGLPCFFSDTVPKEISIADLDVFLDISAGAEPWVRAITACVPDPADRARYSQLLKDTKYSISHSSERLREIYLRG